MQLPNPSDPPHSPSLVSSEQLIETLLTREYWEKICPHLSVSRLDGINSEKPLTKAAADSKKSDFVLDGFFNIDKDEVDSSEICEKLALGIVLLMQHGWQPSFIFMYDEPWEIIERTQRNSLENATGGSKFIGDLYAWYVDPQKNQKGWGPHRDRMGSGPKSFRDDKTPMLSTSWLALTDAGPQNSCLYVVPAGEDPWYHKQDLPEVDPLAAIFEGKPDAYQSIRCLSCPAGSIWHFSHKIIHWGSFARTKASPRIAMSWVVGDSAFEEPAFDRAQLPFPEINTRLALTCGQMIAYGGQTNLSRGFQMLCWRIFKKQSHLLSAFYRDKVEYIFYCRPPPKNVQLKQSTKDSLGKKPTVIIRATKADEEKLQGIKGMFGDSSDSESDSETCEE